MAIEIVRKYTIIHNYSAKQRSEEKPIDTLRVRVYIHLTPYLVQWSLANFTNEIKKIKYIIAQMREYYTYHSIAYLINRCHSDCVMASGCVICLYVLLCMFNLLAMYTKSHMCIDLCVHFHVYGSCSRWEVVARNHSTNINIKRVYTTNTSWKRERERERLKPTALRLGLL